MSFEVPIGLNAKTGVLYEYAKELISDDEWENALFNRSLDFNSSAQGPLYFLEGICAL